MWSFREHRYGGLHRRYRDFNGGVLRCIDPLRREPIAFPTELHYENWLLYWAQPCVRRLQAGGLRLHCMHLGHRFSVRPDLVVTAHTEQIQIVMAVSTPANEKRVQRLALVAKAHDLQWAARMRAEIRAEPMLLRNLDRLRQCATLHVDDRAPAIERLVHDGLRAEPSTTRGHLGQRMGLHLPQSLLDATLLRLHAAGELSLELSGAPYGENTLVRRR
jgi:hypothetical protein